MPSLKRGYDARGHLHYGFDKPLENMSSHSICRKTTEVKIKVPASTLTPSVATVFEKMEILKNDNVKVKKKRDVMAFNSLLDQMIRENVIFYRHLYVIVTYLQQTCLPEI